METTIETLDGDRVKLTVAVDAAEFDTAVDAAYKRLAREVRLPGFRPGKAPRKILEARLGTGAGRQEALQSALPDYYGRAVAELEVDVIDSPEIQITGGVEDGDLTFDAVVPVRPRPSVAGHSSLRVEIPAPVATDAEVDSQIQMLRNQQSTLETVERPAADGDQVTIDIEGTLSGEAVEGLTTTDYLYEVGAGAVVPEIDENLRGASAGDTVEFDAEHPDGEGLLNFRIEIREVQAKVLPDVDDAFAVAASEFDTADELLADLRDRIDTMKWDQAGMLVRDRTAQAVGDLIDMDMPEALIDAEIDGRIRDMAMRLNSQGLEFERYLEAIGSDIATLRNEYRETAEVAARVDLGLRAVAEAEGLDPDPETLESYLETLASQAQSDVATVVEMLTGSGRMIEVRADLRKQAALDWLLERVEIVDEDGNPVDRSVLDAPEDPEPVPEMIPDETDELGKTGDSAETDGGNGPAETMEEGT
ncbi:MAG: trigger factor [Acidimicrobiia bacterium]|nr:trigger factor [Actinomycetota bacterium]MBL6923833.1 trigger factor [Acidimicrobiia bacterium]MBL6925772.1 trigger factor [Acidimicrobiia bacterium]